MTDDPEITEHDPVPATWFARGQWPTCKCGFSPRNNRKLNDHWHEHGFRVVEDHGRLVRHSVSAP